MPQQIERLSHDKAKAVLLAIAARSPQICAPTEVDKILRDEGQTVGLICALASSYGPNVLDEDVAVRTLLGYIADRYYEAGKKAALDEVVALSPRNPTDAEDEALDGLDRGDYFRAGYRAALHAVEIMGSK